MDPSQPSTPLSARRVHVSFPLCLFEPNHKMILLPAGQMWATPKLFISSSQYHWLWLNKLGFCAQAPWSTFWSRVCSFPACFRTECDDVGLPVGPQCQHSPMLTNCQGREKDITLLNHCLRWYIIFYMRAAHPLESRANKIAMESLLLSVQPKSIKSMALKIAKWGQGGISLK